MSCSNTDWMHCFPYDHEHGLWQRLRAVRHRNETVDTTTTTTTTSQSQATAEERLTDI